MFIWALTTELLMVPLFRLICVDFFLCLLFVDFENNVPLDPLEFLEDDS